MTKTLRIRARSKRKGAYTIQVEQDLEHATAAYTERWSNNLRSIIQGLMDPDAYRRQIRCCICFFHRTWANEEVYKDGFYYCGCCGYWAPEFEDQLKWRQAQGWDLELPVKHHFPTDIDTIESIQIGKTPEGIPIYVPREYWLHPTIIHPTIAPSAVINHQISTENAKEA